MTNHSAREALFPDAWEQDKTARVTQMWDTGWPVPMPRFTPVCPHRVCGEAAAIRAARFHKRPTKSAAPWRCDVFFKCMTCGAVWVHGVPVDRDTWAHWEQRGFGGREVPWRVVRQAMERAGYFNDSTEEVTA